MSQVIVNLTLPIVVAKIETVLNDTNAEILWAVNVADLRQRLAAYVLRRLPVIYVTLDQATIQHIGTPSECYSYEQHRHIDRLIQQGLEDLLNRQPIYGDSETDEAPAVVPPPQTEPTDDIAMVSTWFG